MYNIPSILVCVTFLGHTYVTLSVCECASYAGVAEDSVILVGSASDTEGYVMIYRSGWKFLVAQPSHWTDTHAQVVCRQLGYEGGVVPSSTNGYRWVTTVRNMQCTPLL